MMRTRHFDAADERDNRRQRQSIPRLAVEKSSHIERDTWRHEGALVEVIDGTSWKRWRWTKCRETIVYNLHPSGDVKIGVNGIVYMRTDIGLIDIMSVKYCGKVPFVILTKRGRKISPEYYKWVVQLLSC